MISRKQFIKKSFKFYLPVLTFFFPLLSLAHKVFSQTKKTVLPSNFPAAQLILKDPKSIDSSNIEVTPLKDFGTMGTTDHKVDMATWRLKIHGKVEHPVELTLSQIRDLPSVNKKILLICPGFFSNQGLWKGVDMNSLLDKTKVTKDAEKIVFSGADGESVKTETYPVAEIKAGDVFLAYEVNGVPLPRKHGFPLRIVAGNNYGNDWVKYVFEMKFI